MDLQLKIIGYLLLILGLIHIVFPRYFNWSEELNALSPINRQMMYVHTLFIAFTLMIMGFLCLTSAGDLVRTPLGKRLALGIGLFWMLRLLAQFFIYSPKLWKGKVFETAIHVLFSCLWIYFSFIFLWIYFI